MVRLTLCFALLLSMVPWSAASAALVEIVGPPETGVYLEGERIGTLPLSQPLEFERGDYSLEFRLPGHVVGRERVRVREDSAEILLQIDLLPLSRWRSVGYSAVLGGLGQLYQRRTKTGWTMMGLQVAAVSVAAWAETEFQSHQDDFEIADGKYFDAISPSEIERLRAERDAAYDDMETSETIRNAAIAGAVAVGVWSVLDAWWGFDDLTVEAEMDTGAEPRLGMAGLDPQWRLGWTARF